MNADCLMLQNTGCHNPDCLGSNCHPWSLSPCHTKTEILKKSKSGLVCLYLTTISGIVLRQAIYVYLADEAKNTRKKTLQIDLSKRSGVENVSRCWASPLSFSLSLSSSLFSSLFLFIPRSAGIFRQTRPAGMRRADSVPGITCEPAAVARRTSKPLNE